MIVQMETSVTRRLLIESQDYPQAVEMILGNHYLIIDTEYVWNPLAQVPHDV